MRAPANDLVSEDLAPCLALRLIVKDRWLQRRQFAGAPLGDPEPHDKELGPLPLLSRPQSFSAMTSLSIRLSSVRLRIPVERGHRFWLKPATDSGRSRPPILVEAGH